MYRLPSRPQAVDGVAGRDWRGAFPGHGRPPAGAQRPALPLGHRGGYAGAAVCERARPAGVRAPATTQGHVSLA